MGNLPKYVNMIGYCEDLCQITGLPFNEVEKLVNAIFVLVDNNEINPIDGFIGLTSILELKAKGLPMVSSGQSITLTYGM